MSHANGQIKTGSYAVTTVYSMPWSKKPTTAAKTTRKRVEKKVVHKIFEKCSELTKDQYWVSIFRECARDKFPRGFSYKNGLITHRRGNKINRVLIPNSPHEASSICLSFFKASAGLMSATDRKRIQKEEEGRLLEIMNERELSWKDIKAEKVKELLISEYVTELAHKLEFNIEQKKELLTTVKSGFMLKYFTSKNITMIDGRISNISGLIYDTGNNRYSIDSKLTNKRPGRKVKGLGIERVYKKPKVSFTANWEKYLLNLEKKNNIRSSNNFHIIDGSGSHSLSGDLYPSSITPSDTISMSPTTDSM